MKCFLQGRKAGQRGHLPYMITIPLFYILVLMVVYDHSIKEKHGEVSRFLFIFKVTCHVSLQCRLSEPVTNRLLLLLLLLLL